MLLPVTSSLVWWARRPEIAEFIERSTGGSSGVGGWMVSGARQRGVGSETSVSRPIGTSTPPTTALGSSPLMRTEPTVPVTVAPFASV